MSELVDAPPRVVVVSAMLPAAADPVRGIVVRREIDRLRQAGVLVVEIGKAPGVRGYLRQAARIVRATRGQRADVVHAHYGTTGFVAALCAPRVPLVVTMHGSDLAHGPRPGLSKYWVQYLLSLAGAVRARRVLVQDETMLDQLPGRMRRKAEVLGQAVDLGQARTGAGRDGPVVGDRAREGVLFLSDRARPVKRFWLAEQAMAGLPGGRAALRSLDQYPPDQVLAAMAAARIGLLTSEREGMPVAVKEALACGLRVVATDLPPLQPVARALPFALGLADGTPQAVGRALTEAMAQPPIGAEQQAVVDDYLAARGWVEPAHTDRLRSLYQQIR